MNGDIKHIVGSGTMKRFISFSGGVESTTMCILYGKGATAIWCVLSQVALQASLVLCVRRPNAKHFVVRCN
jgi:PP-loop superfamily ATP-utilizing enzyme